MIISSTRHRRLADPAHHRPYFYGLPHLIHSRDDLCPLFTGPAWQRITSETSPLYHPLVGPLLIFEAVGNFFFAVAAIVLLVLIFSKHPLLPKTIIGFYILTLVFISLDGALASFTPFFANAISHITEALTHSIISSAIWIPYFLRSRRVKNTFVEREASASAIPPPVPSPQPTSDPY